MATEAVKSAQITNLDAVPVVRVTEGTGAPGFLRSVDGSAAFTSGPTAGSTYQLVRLPTAAKVKSVKLWLDAAVTTFTGNVGIYYSTSSSDGTPKANQGTAVNATFFGSAVALAAVIEPTETSGQSGTYVGALRMKQLWDALGLSTDPGGFFDLVVTTTATNNGAGVVNGQVDFVL